MNNFLRFLFYQILFIMAAHLLPYTHIHISSYPFIAGDTFRQWCNFVVDEASHFDPSQVQRADIIFVQADFLEKFFTQLHPLISQPYIIVSHNCGYAADNPIPGTFYPHLDDPKLIAWFAKNVDRSHPKLHPLPIGLANQFWPHGNIKIFEECIKEKTKHKRRRLLYMNFSTSTYPGERNSVYHLFAQKLFCSKANPKPLKQYLHDLAHYKFTLSPRGNGLDCHRTWEALLMGCFPIVKTSTLDPLFQDLPVVIINDWNEITEEFLNHKYQELSHKSYNLNKLYAPYWFDQIKACQAEARLVAW